MKISELLEAIKIGKKEEDPAVESSATTAMFDVSSLIGQVPGGLHPLGANEQAIRKYQKLFRAGSLDQIPPIEVAKRGRRLILVDGHHRVCAAARENVDKIRGTWVK